MEGTADATETLAIDHGALQWRLEWECEAGALVLAADSTDEALVDASCPDSGTAYAIQPGGTTLDVDAVILERHGRSAD